jgi:hypothetical protein
MIRFVAIDDEFHPLCHHCRYPLLDLSGFDGLSCADNTDLVRETVVASCNPLRSLLREVRHQRHRQWVRRMRRELLPEYPFCLICPSCYLIVKRGLSDAPDAPPQYVQPMSRLPKR